ncbi:hypothetical protein VCHC37A1_0507A, partial [Vibrio cholerae HC-37A1]
MEQLGSSSG